MIVGRVAALRPLVSEVTDVVCYGILVGRVGLVDMVLGAARLCGEQGPGPDPAFCPG